MEAWKCEGCDYIYKAEHNSNANNEEAVNWYELPKDWTCPVCGLGVECFSEV
ncbi:MAG: rubredoxin [Planctomycetota bacterium]